MDRLSSRKREQKNKQNRNVVMALAATLAVLCPPVGIVLAFRSAWSGRMRLALSAVGVGCMLLYAALLPSADSRVNGGIEMVGRKREVEVYGPDLPTAMVTGYVAPPSQSILR